MYRHPQVINRHLCPSTLQALSMLIACCVHAVDHPGLTNQYLIMTENPLAELYNNISVIQNNRWTHIRTHTHTHTHTPPIHFETEIY